MSKKQHVRDISVDNWNTIVACIYDASLSSERWPAALEAMGKPIFAHTGQLAVISSRADATLENINFGFEESSMRRFQSMVEDGSQIRVNATAYSAEMRTITDYDLVSSDTMEKHPFYQEHAIAERVPFCGATVVSRQRDTFVCNALMREAKYGNLNKEEIEYMNRLAPHIRRAIELSLSSDYPLGIGNVLEVVDQLNCAAFCVNDKRRVTARNAQAAVLLAERDGISDSNCSISLSDDEADRELARELTKCFAVDFSSEKFNSGKIVAKRPSGSSPYTLFVVSLNRKALASFDEHFAIVMVRRLEDKLYAAKKFLVEEYSLSGAEVDVSLKLAQGMNIQDIAIARSCSITTVRTLLNRVFSKTDCPNQAGLVGLVFRNEF